MLYYDPTESRDKTNLPQSFIDYGKPMTQLEGETGADLLVIPEPGLYEQVNQLKTSGKTLIDIKKQLGIELSALLNWLKPFCEYALHEYLLAGSVLVQRKSGYDFLNSMGDRLNHSIAKMCRVSHKQYQRIILVTGIFSNNNGDLLLNGKPTNYKYNNFVGALSSIKYKGACVEFVASDTDILDWIKVQERQLLSYKRKHTKWLVPTVYYPPDMPDLDDPLQLMIPGNDCRKAMKCIPGWGVEKINTLYQYVQQFYNPVSLFHLLSYATSQETAKHCKGIGKGLINKAREYVGLNEGEYLCASKNNLTIQKGI